MGSYWSRRRGRPVRSGRNRCHHPVRRTGAPAPCTAPPWQAGPSGGGGDRGAVGCALALVDGGTVSGPEGAAALDAELTALDLPRLRRDVDTAADLNEALTLGVGPRTAAALGPRV